MDGQRWRYTISGSIREIVFGLEDSLVSTLGAVTGIAAGAQSTYIVILSGLVLIAVEATSMAAGSYLSSKSAALAEAELTRAEGARGTGVRTGALRAAGVMGIFYLFGGFVPVLPYFFLPVNIALFPSVALTAAVLFLVGVWSAAFARRSRLKGGIEMVTVSLGAAFIGYLIGRAVSAVFGASVVG